MEKGLSFLEFNYMIMQSYDFYYMFQHYGCNMQFGGDDQWSNMLGGTELIRRKLGKDAYAMPAGSLKYAMTDAWNIYLAAGRGFETPTIRCRWDIRLITKRTLRKFVRRGWSYSAKKICKF